MLTYYDHFLDPAASGMGRGLIDIYWIIGTKSFLVLEKLTGDTKQSR